MAIPVHSKWFTVPSNINVTIINSIISDNAIISNSFMLVSHWRRRRGDVAATPATDQSRRLRRLVKPKIASTHTRATSPRQMFGSRGVVSMRSPTSRGDVSMRSPTSHGDVSETSSEFLSRLQ